jgi:integrase/recombinase XerD
VSVQDDDLRWDLYPVVASNPHARAFIRRLQQFPRRPKTVDAYARNLNRFLASFVDAPMRQWMEADEGELLTYLEDLRHGRLPLAPRTPRRAATEKILYLSGARAADATVAQHVVALRQFYDYLIRTRLRQDGLNPLPQGSNGRGGCNGSLAEERREGRRGPAQIRTRLPWIAPPAVWDRIVLHIVLRATARNRALLLVGYDGALRREELVGLRTDDYDRPRALLLVRAETSKSGWDRWIPLSPFGQRTLDHYLDRHRCALVATIGADGRNEHGPLFVSESTRNPGRPLAPGAVNDVVEALRAELALPQLHPHTFRHQRLTALKVAGVPLEDIALFAGHRSTDTTRLYLHLTPTELGEKIRAATREMDAHLERLIQEADSGQ